MTCDRGLSHPVCTSRKQAAGRDRGYRGCGTSGRCVVTCKKTNMDSLEEEDRVQDLASFVLYYRSCDGFLGQAFESPFDLRLKVGKQRPRRKALLESHNASRHNGMQVWVKPEDVQAPEVTTFLRPAVLSQRNLCVSWSHSTAYDRD